jgi:hypothetical protein
MAGSFIPPIPITINFAASQSVDSFTPTVTQQLQFITDKTNPFYLRHMNLTQDGLYMQIGTGSVFISKSNLYGVASQALTVLTWPPIIQIEPTSSIVTHTAAVYFVASASVAQYTPNATVQWYSSSYAQSLVGQFSTLTNTGIYNGTTTNALSCSATSTSMNQSQFFCVYSNASGNTTSSLAALTVN